MSATAVGSSRLAYWQRLNLCLLVAGYTGYYLCRSNLSVTMPLLFAELQRRGIDPGAAQIMLGSIASYGVLAYAIGKFPSGNLADRIGGRRNFLFGMGGSIAFTSSSRWREGCRSSPWRGWEIGLLSLWVGRAR